MVRKKNPPKEHPPPLSNDGDESNEPNHKRPRTLGSQACLGEALCVLPPSKRGRARRRVQVQTPPSSSNFDQPNTSPLPISIVGESSAPPLGAPEDMSLLKSYDCHVAYKIWIGQNTRKPLETHNRQTSLEKWPFRGVCQFVRKIVREAGLTALVEFTHENVDRPLINAFIERFYPETNTFHLPFGEMTITFYDVEVILGVRMEGMSVTGTLELDLSRQISLVMSTLGVSYEDADKELSNNGYLTFAWLRDHFMQCGEDASDKIKERAARAYMLYIIGCTLCPNKSGDGVSARYLQCLVNLERIQSYSWGSAALTCLFREMGIASRSETKQVTGCFSLLQTWIYEHFPSIDRKIENDSYVNGQPRIGRWKPHFESTSVTTNLIKLRKELDDLPLNQITWDPYECHRDLYPINEISFYMGIMVCFDLAEPYYPDRVLRQFGRLQYRPTAPLTMNAKRKGKTAQAYKVSYQVDPWHFDNWRDHILTGDRRSTQVQQQSDCTNDYMQWYSMCSHPTVINPENRVKDPIPSIAGTPATGTFAQRLQIISKKLLCRAEEDRPVSPTFLRRAAHAIDCYASTDFEEFGDGGRGAQGDKGVDGDEEEDVDDGACREDGESEDGAMALLIVNLSK